MWQDAPAPKHTQVKNLDLVTSMDADQALDGPFGFLSTTSFSDDVLSEKWKTVRQKAESEASVLSRCVTEEECPAAARRFLEIVAEGRARQGLARVGVINRAVNLSVIPTSDMKQWGVPDRWSPPLETLETERGDCEDYAILKYFALLDAGVREEDLRLVIVRNLLPNEDHALLVARVNGEWVVLDNRWLALVPDGEVRQVIPLFVLGDSGVRAFVPEGGATGLAVGRLPLLAKPS
jgi:predicted transglutaminase-like cysteine proteinase